jgi:hypothetical protein
VQNQKNVRGSKLDKGCRFYTMAALRFFGIIRLKPASTLVRKFGSARLEEAYADGGYLCSQMKVKGFGPT